MSFVRPVLEYGDIVWDNCNVRESTLFEDIQITAARIITGLRINSSKSNFYLELGWDMFCVKRKVHKLILFYKIVYGLAPQYLLKPCFPPQSRYSLRNHDGLN